MTAGEVLDLSSVKGGNKRQGNLLPPKETLHVFRYWILQLPAIKLVSGNYASSPALGGKQAVPVSSLFRANSSRKLSASTSKNSQLLIQFPEFRH